MSSYLNNLLTTTTSRYNSLRRQLLSDEVDGDTEDDSHISRVLRAYYTEKGRPFPPWLPPDPKAPQSASTQFVSSSGRQPAQQPLGRGGGGGGLSDLWDAPQQQQVPQQPQSLRRGLGRGGPAMSYQGRSGANSRLSPEPQAQGRPLPSQRAGSYQSTFSAAEPSPPPSAGSGSTAQERLKARLWGGGRSTSPSQGQASSANTSPAPGPGGFRNSPNPPRGPGGGSRPPYPEERSSGYSSGGGRQQQPPQNSYGMSASAAPGWDYDPYAPDNYNSAPQPQPQPPRGAGGRVGLPSGPRMR